MKKILCGLTLIAALAGWSPAATVPDKPAVKAPIAPRGPSPDEQIQNAIRLKFAKSKINAEHFTVTVRNGVATIEGKTAVIQHKGVATRLARSGGATTVRNNIQVSEEAKAKAAARLARNTGGSATLPKASVLPAQ